MELEPIITALRARCSTLSNRVAAAAEFNILPESAALPVPCAFVIPLDDAPQESMAMNSVRQVLNDSFAVVVALDNRSDEKGQTGMRSVHAMRAELWSALLGWRPDLRYDGINYEGGNLLKIDRARVWYQFEFGALMEIEPSDGYQETDLAGLPHFDGAKISTDVIDPIADPNVQYPGPDNRIEVQIVIPKSGNLP